MRSRGIDRECFRSDFLENFSRDPTLVRVSALQQFEEDWDGLLCPRADEGFLDRTSKHRPGKVPFQDLTERGNGLLAGCPLGGLQDVRPLELILPLVVL